jgi:hypothetical protein
VLYFNHKNRFSEEIALKSNYNGVERVWESKGMPLIKSKAASNFNQFPEPLFAFSRITPKNGWSWISYNNLKHSFTRTCHYFLCTFRTGHKNKISDTEVDINNYNLRRKYADKSFYYDAERNGDGKFLVPQKLNYLQSRQKPFKKIKCSHSLKLSLSFPSNAWRLSKHAVLLSL